MSDFARKQSRAGADIEDVHARAQSRAVERLTPIALAGAERHDAARAVVVFGRPIEQRVDDTLSICRCGSSSPFQRAAVVDSWTSDRVATSRGREPHPPLQADRAGRRARPRRAS